MPRRMLGSLVLLMVCGMSVYGADTDGSVEGLLNKALLVVVKMSVNSPDGQQELWSNRVSKITIQSIFYE